MSTLERIRKALDEYEHSIPTCAYDKRSAVLGRLAEQFCEGLAGLAEDLTHEDGSDVCDQAEGIIEAMNCMFIDAAGEADDRRTPESRAAYRADLQRDLHNA